MERMTKREFLMAIAQMEGIDPELNLYAEQEITKMDERNAKRKNSPSKKSIENAPIKEKIVDFLKGCEGNGIASEIAEKVEISTQKASALCRQLVSDGVLKVEDVKVKGKGKVKAYSLA